jgi:hypothetical protein
MRRYLDLGVGVGDLRRPVRPLSWARNDRHHLQVIEFETVKRLQERTDKMLPEPTERYHILSRTYYVRFQIQYR